jgi:hypothetical protein
VYVIDLNAVIDLYKCRNRPNRSKTLSGGHLAALVPSKNFGDAYYSVKANSEIFFKGHSKNFTDAVCSRGI